MPPLPVTPAAPVDSNRPLPITLPTALKLAGVSPLDVALASQRIRVAAAQLARAQVLWLPSITIGPDYYRHDGQIQAVQGNVFTTSKSSLMFGAGSGIGPNAIVDVDNAIFAPLAARQVMRAREAEMQAVRNDILLSVAEAYFNVQQARGDLAGAEDAVRRAEELARRAEKLAQGLVSPVEATRTRVEVHRRRQVAQAALERWRTSSAELARVLRLDRTALVVPLEPPHLRVTLISLARPVDDLIPVALTNRPELAARQALVQAALQRLRQEKLRPLIPSVLLRGASTTVTGTLGAGYFGGGINNDLSNFGARMDYDLQVLWEFQNLGFGNRALVRERQAENRAAVLEVFRIQDVIAAEVAQAYAQAQAAAARTIEAEAEVRDAVLSVTQNFQGLGQTQRAGNLNLLVVRPQEALAAVQALAQAYADYYGAVGDYDRVQFRLFRALGHPSQVLSEEGIPGLPAPSCPPPLSGNVSPHP